MPTALRRLIDGFDPAPAYVLGPHWEFAAWNAAEARLYPPLRAGLDGIERNLIWVLFAHPDVRRLIVDWDIHARQALAEFRAATIGVRHDPLMVDAASTGCDGRARSSGPGGPSTTSPASRPGCAASTTRRAGLLTFEYQQLTPAEWPALRVVVQLPVPGDDSAQRLAVRHDPL